MMVIALMLLKSKISKRELGGGEGGMRVFLEFLKPFSGFNNDITQISSEHIGAIHVYYYADDA